MIDYVCYGDMSFQYLVAAASLWNQVVESPMLYNPTRFLIRHSIELSLKGHIIKLTQEQKPLSSIGEITISGRKLDSIHSVKTLWEYALSLNADFIDDQSGRLKKSVLKLDKVDFSSTKYRYPIDRNGIKTPLEPVSINWDDKAPDISNGIPMVAIGSEKIGCFSKGIRHYEDTRTLFDVATCLVEML